MTERVFVLGAGASIGHSAGRFPGIRDFFKLAKSLQLTVVNDNARSVATEYKGLETYTKNRFGRSIIGSSNMIDVEELLTSIQIDIQRTSDSDLISIERSLKRLVRNVLVLLSDQIDVDRSEYHDFKQLLSSDDSVVTFNWDLLFDRLLMEQLDPMYAMRESQGGGKVPAHYKNFIDRFAILSHRYHQLGTQKYQSMPGFPYTESEPVTPFYLKLHGSIDWFVCGNTSCKAARELFLVPKPEERYFCLECYEPLINLLVPPVLNKPLYDIPVIRRIWNAAARAMSTAKEVVIWGYSVPPTDFHSRWLLRHARQSRLQAVTFIDPVVIGGQKTKKGARIPKGYVERVLQIFEGLDQPPEVKLYESFTDYKNKFDVFDKYHISKKPRILADFVTSR